MDILGHITIDEELGRAVSSSRTAERARRSRIPKSVLVPKEGEIEMSMDRLSVAGYECAMGIATIRELERERTFYGWAVVLAGTAANMGCKVIASRQPGNRFHADMVFPMAESKEEQLRYGQQLADVAHWLDNSKVSFS